MTVIDLTKLRDELPDGFRSVQNLIGRVLDLNSSRTDLRIAADLSAHALSFVREPPALTAEIYEDLVLSLTSSAIIFYVRATKSSSDHRRTFDLRSYFDDAERDTHELLCGLRDDALAHYGPGELPEGQQLRSDHLFVSPDGQLVAVSRTTYGTERLAEMTLRQGQRAALIMQRLFHEEEARLIEALNELASEPAIEPARKASLVELGAVIDDERMAGQILDGPRTGHRRIHPNERDPSDPARD